MFLSVSSVQMLMMHNPPSCWVLLVVFEVGSISETGSPSNASNPVCCSGILDLILEQLEGFSR